MCARYVLCLRRSTDSDVDFYSMASSSDATPLASQVGGHNGIQSTADGSLIIKPCLPAEGEFYTRLSTSSDFAHLRPFIPRFIGVLRLEGSVELDESGSVKTGEVKQIPDESGQEVRHGRLIDMIQWWPLICHILRSPLCWKI